MSAIGSPEPHGTDCRRSLSSRARRRLRYARGVAALFAATVAIVSGCDPSTSVATERLSSYTDAVQSADVQALFCLVAGAAGSEELGVDRETRVEGLTRWFDDLMRRYEVDRDIGRVEIEEDPAVLVRLLTLGKGSYYRVERARIDGDRLDVDLTVRLAYGSIDVAPLSPGTTFYVAGVPPGRVHAVRIPRSSAEITHRVLAEVPVRFTFVRAAPADGCGERWAVAEAAVDGDGTSAETLTWVF